MALEHECGGGGVGRWGNQNASNRNDRNSGSNRLWNPLKRKHLIVINSKKRES